MSEDLLETTVTTAAIDSASIWYVNCAIAHSRICLVSTGAMSGTSVPTGARNVILDRFSVTALRWPGTVQVTGRNRCIRAPVRELRT